MGKSLGPSPAAYQILIGSVGKLPLSIRCYMLPTGNFTTLYHSFIFDYGGMNHMTNQVVFH